MAFVAVYDACVLFPAPLRDLLIRLARERLVDAKWTEEILDECFRNLQRMRPDLRVEQLERVRTLMNAAIPDVLVAGYSSLIPSITLPDPNDRHVVAAAVRSGAQVIVTHNVKDFPGDALARFNIEAQPPDEFVLALIDLAPASIVKVLTEQSAALRNPPVSVEQLLETLLAQGLPRSVAAMRRLFSDSR